MPLQLALLNKIKPRPTKTVAQCPACAEAGGDSHGVHLVVYPDGRFGCTANPKDKAHRRRIAELAGDPQRQVNPWTIKLRGVVVMSGGQNPTTTGTPILSLTRAAVMAAKQSCFTPSEVSAPVITIAQRSCFTPSEASAPVATDKTDTLKPLTRYVREDIEPHIIDTLHVKRFFTPSEVSAPPLTPPAPPPTPAPPRPMPAMPTFDDLRPDAPHLAGWHRNRTPIYLGTEREWQTHFPTRPPQLKGPT